jgi:hypothetical protein
VDIELLIADLVATHGPSLLPMVRSGTALRAVESPKAGSCRDRKVGWGGARARGAAPSVSVSFAPPTGEPDPAFLGYVVSAPRERLWLGRAA